MAIAVVGTPTQGLSIGATTLTFSFTSSGNALFVGVTLADNIAVSSVTFNGDSLTELWDFHDGVANRCAGYLMVAPDAGAHDVLVTVASTPTFIWAGAVGFSGVDQATPNRTVYTTASATAHTLTVVDSQNGDMVVDCIAATSTNITGGGGQTEQNVDDSIAGGSSSAGTSTEPASGANTVMSWTGATYSAIGATALVPAPPLLTQTQFQFFGAGDELPHYDAAIVPVITSITHTNNTSTSTLSKAINYPAHSTGDLLIMALASDADVSHTPPANGPNSETINVIADDIDPGSNGPHLSTIWWVSTGDEIAGTLTWTLSGNETCSAECLRILAANFYVTTPIGTIGAASSSDADSANAVLTAFTPNRSGGLVVAIGACDADPMANPFSGAGWTDQAGAGRDDGAQNSFVSTRTALSVASTQVDSVNFDINPTDSYSLIGFVINGTVSVADGRSPIGAEGEDLELEVATDYGVSARVENSGGAETEDTYKWQYKLNAGSWTDLTDTSSVIKASATADFLNGADVQEYIGGTGTYVVQNNAALDTTGTLVLSAVLGGESSFESHLNFQIVAADVVDGDVIYLRIVYEDGTALDSYGASDTNVPAITVNEVGGATATNVILMVI